MRPEPNPPTGACDNSATATVVLLAVYWPVGAVALVFLAFVVLSQRLVLRRQRTLSIRVVREQSDVAMISASALGQIEVIKSSGAEDALVRHLEGDRTVELRVLGQVNGAHAAVADATNDAVAAEL